jgi:acyl-CoA synthetase (NDP forming)
MAKKSKKIRHKTGIKKHISKHKPIKKHIPEKKIIIEVKKPVMIEKMPDEKAFDLIKKYKIPLIQQTFIKNDKDLQLILNKLGFPCVMKVSGNILHRTEVGGVRVNIQSVQQATETFKHLMRIKGADKVLIQKQATGKELIVGIKRDSSFGHIITVGIGGIFVEILKDVIFRVCPISLQDAENMIRELKGYEILKGMRGERGIDFNSLYEILLKVSKLAVNEKIKQMDINPLFCSERGCFAIDVRIIK